MHISYPSKSWFQGCEAQRCIYQFTKITNVSNILIQGMQLEGAYQITMHISIHKIKNITNIGNHNMQPQGA